MQASGLDKYRSSCKFTINKGSVMRGSAALGKSGQLGKWDAASFFIRFKTFHKMRKTCAQNDSRNARSGLKTLWKPCRQGPGGKLDILGILHKINFNLLTTQVRL